MRLLCDVIIGFATVLQITLASSIIPIHSESFGVLARNPSSSIKEKKFLPHNVFAKREPPTPGTATCTSSIYSNSKLQQSLYRNCVAKKAKSAKFNRPLFPSFPGSNTFFPTPGPYFQIPAKAGFFPLNFLKNLFLGKHFFFFPPKLTHRFLVSKIFLLSLGCLVTFYLREI
ncbi:hypothetical protein GcC1_117020 [Golovinomyces cichoracearum]|uniref:Secreted effector protein n=1 Tax=Golovinomyces cichoracearum TaxID=62708 RepID=A0A420I7T0_9PEZI|nr:hypothetical protein GcC1_117020 [Golovinomyces cichoracearum]